LKNIVKQGELIVHPFPVGTRVETNDNYFKQFGRKMVGTSVAMNPTPPKELTIFRCEFQEGNIIPDHAGNNVLMLSKDLQEYKSN
jgi:hypothetical protein